MKTTPRLRIAKLLPALLAGALSLPAAATGAPPDENQAAAPAAIAAGALPSLNEYLARRRAALATQPATDRRLHAKVSAESRSGIRRLRIREFQYLSDSPRSFAGYDIAAGSWPTEVAVIAGAVAEEFLIHAAAKNIPLDTLEVTVTSRPDTQGASKVAYPRNIVWTACVGTPATDAQLEDLRATVARVSPVLALLAEPQGIPHGKVVFKTTAPERPVGQPPGLRDFLSVEKRPAILKLQSAAPSAPGAGTYPLHAISRVAAGSGIRSAFTDDKAFHLVHDNPHAEAGFNTAPPAYEHQLGVLGTCLTHITEIVAATKEIILDGLEVHVEGTLTPRAGSGDDATPPRYKNVRYTILLDSPADEATLTALRDAVEATCPIYNLLNDRQEIEGRVIRGAPPAGWNKLPPTL